VSIADQPLPGDLRLATVATEQRGDVDLQQRAVLDHRPQPPEPLLEQARGALGMGDQHAEPVPAHVSPGGEERRVDAVERHLEQHPARARRALGDHGKLFAAEVGCVVGKDLAARVQPQVDARGVDRRLERACALRDRRHGDREVGVADVGRDGRLVDAVAREPRGVRQRGTHVRGTVVHPGEQMQMKVDVRHHGSRFAARARNRVSNP
jgi:hypothetical protein